MERETRSVDVLVGSTSGFPGPSSFSKPVTFSTVHRDDFPATEVSDYPSLVNQQQTTSHHGSLQVYGKAVAPQAVGCPPILAARPRLGIPPTPQHCFASPPVPNRQGSPSWVQGQAGICCRPCWSPTWRTQASESQRCVYQRFVVENLLDHVNRSMLTRLGPIIYYLLLRYGLW